MSLGDFFGLFHLFERAAGAIEKVLNWLDAVVRAFSETHRPVERTMEAAERGLHYIAGLGQPRASPQDKKKE